MAITNETFEIFLAAAPGMEELLCEELKGLGFRAPRVRPGGVIIEGNWPDVWRANLQVRGASRVLARINSFRVNHLAQLDKRSRQIPWSEVLKPDVPVRVEATCRKSKIYHSKAAAERVETAITEEQGVAIDKEADVSVRVRIDNNLCTISIDTSGDLLHRRGHKEAVGKAPMRENLAANFLRACGYKGDEPVYDPMCGSGTFVIEAAEIASGRQPGRTRTFAFEKLATFDAEQWSSMRNGNDTVTTPHTFTGTDRDGGAIKVSQANAQRAGVSDITAFAQRPVSDIERPEGPPGLVIVNPPYGDRIGNKKTLRALYGSLGAALNERLSGWRVGLITNEAGLAKETGLNFGEPGPFVDHGGLKVRLWQTGKLA